MLNVWNGRRRVEKEGSLVTNVVIEQKMRLSRTHPLSPLFTRDKCRADGNWERMEEVVERRVVNGDYIYRVETKLSKNLRGN